MESLKASRCYTFLGKTLEEIKQKFETFIKVFINAELNDFIASGKQKRFS